MTNILGRFIDYALLNLEAMVLHAAVLAKSFAIALKELTRHHCERMQCVAIGIWSCRDGYVEDSVRYESPAFVCSLHAMVVDITRHPPGDRSVGFGSCSLYLKVRNTGANGVTPTIVSSVLMTTNSSSNKLPISEGSPAKADAAFGLRFRRRRASTPRRSLLHR